MTELDLEICGVALKYLMSLMFCGSVKFVESCRMLRYCNKSKFVISIGCTVLGPGLQTFLSEGHITYFTKVRQLPPGQVPPDTF